MIWRQHKLIFLHIPRTGGTSLEIALSGGRDPLEVEQEEGCWHKHFDALRAEAMWPEFAAPDYRVVAFVVREVWARGCSSTVVYPLMSVLKCE